MDQKTGCPEVPVPFTNTVSHKMAKCALDGIEGGTTKAVRCHRSSKTALSKVLEEVQVTA